MDYIEIPGRVVRVFQPLPEGHPALEQECQACTEKFQVGDRTVGIPLGPGNDPEERRLASQGRAFNSVTALVHVECATGVEEE